MPSLFHHWKLKTFTLTAIISLGNLQTPQALFSQQAKNITDSSNAAMFSGTTREKNLAALHDPYLPGAMPTYYSPGQKRRAQFLQNLISGEIAFYSDVFGLHFAPITLAVLDPQQWSKVVIFNYGVPSMSSPPYIFTMPSDWSKSDAVPFPSKEDVDEETLKRAHAERHSWKDLQYEGGDGIGTHEIGHSITLQLGIDTQTRWFHEFLASYIGYAYLQAKKPREVLGNEVFWNVGYAKTPHPHSDLEYMDTNFRDLVTKDPVNYAWYQFALDQRLLVVYKQEGLGFISKVRQSFPEGGPKLNTAQVLEKLELIDPGWKAWAAAGLDKQHSERGQNDASPQSGK
jgi:hypothetical protein